MPAEWARHDATWISWPHHEPDWPGKIGPIPWVYAEIVRALAPHERVEILCHDETVRDDAARVLAMHAVNSSQYRLHLQPTDRAWLRVPPADAPKGNVDQMSECPRSILRRTRGRTHVHSAQSLGCVGIGRGARGVGRPRARANARARPSAAGGIAARRRGWAKLGDIRWAFGCGLSHCSQSKSRFGDKVQNKS